MARTLAQMTAKVGAMVRDTSTTFASLIDQWINDAYDDAWGRCMWSDIVDENFTFESIANQAEYTISTIISANNFGEELAVVNIATGSPLQRSTINQYWKERATSFQNDSIPAGTPYQYIVLPEAGTIRLDPKPEVAETYAMPYKKTVATLTSTSTSAISRLDKYLEYAATGMAFAYKKRYSSASYWNNQAENELKKRISQEKYKINQFYQRLTCNYRVDQPKSLLGENSYA